MLGRDGVVDELKYIRCPTLVLVGNEDRATPVAESERIAAGIPGARLEVITPAGHSSSIEAPAAVTAALLQFVTAVDAGSTAAAERRSEWVAAA